MVSWNTGFQRLKQIQCDGVTFHQVFFLCLFFPLIVSFFLTRCKPSCFSGFTLLAVTSGKLFFWMDFSFFLFIKAAMYKRNGISLGAGK